MHMDWIVENIAIGNYLDARDRDAISAAGIKSIVSLDGSLVGVDAEELGVDAIYAAELIDGPGNSLQSFRSAVGRLEYFVLSCPPVLVQCHAGQSRSVSVVAAYLVRQRGLKVAEAYSEIARHRETNVMPALVSLVARLVS